MEGEGLSFQYDVIFWVNTKHFCCFAKRKKNGKNKNKNTMHSALSQATTSQAFYFGSHTEKKKTIKKSLITQRYAAIHHKMSGHLYFHFSERRGRQWISCLHLFFTPFRRREHIVLDTWQIQPPRLSNIMGHWQKSYCTTCPLVQSKSKEEFYTCSSGLLLLRAGHLII